MIRAISIGRSARQVGSHLILCSLFIRVDLPMRAVASQTNNGCGIGASVRTYFIVRFILACAEPDIITVNEDNAR